MPGTKVAGEKADKTAPLREGGAKGASPERPLPNVLLVTIDTLRADHLHCYGYERETTPTIDRLAAEGVLILDCRTQAPNTHPSMASMLTSLPVSSFDNYAMENFLPSSAVTMNVSPSASGPTGVSTSVEICHVAGNGFADAGFFLTASPSLPQ